VSLKRYNKKWWVSNFVEKVYIQLISYTTIYITMVKLIENISKNKINKKLSINVTINKCTFKYMNCF